MKRNYRLIVIALGALIAASLAYLLLTRSQTENPIPSTTPESTSRTDSTTQATSGTYVTYDPERAATTEGTKLLFFHAPWCPQCRALEQSIKESGVPADVTIFKVDYDSNHALRQKYGVTLQTTVVSIDDAGNRIESFVAYDEPSLDAVSRELLQ